MCHARHMHCHALSTFVQRKFTQQQCASAHSQNYPVNVHKVEYHPGLLIWMGTHVMTCDGIRLLSPVFDVTIL